MLALLAGIGADEVCAAPATIAEHEAACAGRDGWSDPAPPVRIFGNVYDVGTCGITVLLVRGDKGAILIDAATAEAVPSLLANLRGLELQPRDVKLLLSTHEHLDHAGGLAALKRATGAPLAARAAARGPLEAGLPAADDPQRDGEAMRYEGVAVDRVLRDGETVRLGNLRLTAHATPGHSPGGTSWSWRACAEGRCVTVAYADSVSAVAREGYRFTDHPERVAALERSFATIAALRCDLLITPHPGASNLYPRLAGAAPLIQAGACARYAAAGQAALATRLAREAAR